MKSKYFDYIKLITDLYNKGFSYEEIAHVLCVNGVDTSESGVRAYVNNYLPELKNNTRKPKKDDVWDNEKCKSCIYHTKLSGMGETIVACYFNVVMHRSRGCKGGSQCTEYVKGNRRWNYEDTEKFKED